MYCVVDVGDELCGGLGDVLCGGCRGCTASWM